MMTMLMMMVMTMLMTMMVMVNTQHKVETACIISARASRTRGEASHSSSHVNSHVVEEDGDVDDDDDDEEEEDRDHLVEMLNVVRKSLVQRPPTDPHYPPCPSGQVTQLMHSPPLPGMQRSKATLDQLAMHFLTQIFVQCTRLKMKDRRGFKIG